MSSGSHEITDRDQLMQILEARFEDNMHRHSGITWPDVLAKLARNAAAVKSLRAIEASGGEPDVIGGARGARDMAFCDCSAESPAGGGELRGRAGDTIIGHAHPPSPR